ncbi:hypothetical protein NDU88_005612 [Pleurodeles waltl]|uniref:Uncharacterized protein n=1 Tax=Pleurodeles waltl TaxID=8319 RepID=A0AAV7NQS0_PLEWA|nr:hypothetical protein NDU88_005612 [Pleurodeles waltl]
MRLGPLLLFKSRCPSSQRLQDWLAGAISVESSYRQIPLTEQLETPITPTVCGLSAAASSALSKRIRAQSTTPPGSESALEAMCRACGYSFQARLHLCMTMHRSTQPWLAPRWKENLPLFKQ